MTYLPVATCTELWALEFYTWNQVSSGHSTGKAPPIPASADARLMYTMMGIGTSASLPLHLGLSLLAL